ncbi:MAG: thymidine phosphorylase [Blastocatellia bacterium]|nr:thymidine phosphorylase [Blastocatellia bacterium]
MRPQKIIEAKRDGAELTREQIDSFIEGVCDDSWADYQTAALLMAMFTRGLSQAEQDALTYAMLHSGVILDLSGIEGPKVDKHSTGGVGDKTSLVIAPIVAACGGTVPMISGRGLGHTGGTLDKLESIPGYNVNLSCEGFREVLKMCGYAMSGQTSDIAPADKKLYALRDATATVPYLPLIVSSIMSKKLAEGLDALVLDVKSGSGAFMKREGDARDLAAAMVRTGEAFGVKTQAIISNMAQPLGAFVGNALEVYECVRILQGETEPAWRDTAELSFELAAHMLVLSDLSGGMDKARSRVEEAVNSGEALAKFSKNCELQGGDPKVCEKPERVFEESLVRVPIKAPAPGYISGVDALAIGDGVVALGGGRLKAEDDVDHAVGFRCDVKVGEEVREGDLLGEIYCRTDEQGATVLAAFQTAYTITPEPVVASILIIDVI